MKIKDALLGRFTNSSDSSDSSADEDASSTDPVVTSESNWVYAYDEIGTEMNGDLEMKSFGYLDHMDPEEDDPEVYAGEYPRQVLNSSLSRTKESTWLGYSKHELRDVRPEGIDFNSLFRHIAIFGQTGYGKSTLLGTMMIQWIMSGYGLCFFDQNGDDCQKLMQSIPEERLDDVIWIEPGSTREREIGINFFEPSAKRGEKAHERQVRKIGEDFIELLNIDAGPRMESVTSSLIRQLAKAEENFTPLDFYRLIEEEEDRKIFAEEFGNSFEKPSLRKISNMEEDELSPVSRRAKEWVEGKEAREVLSRKESTFFIDKAVENRKILLVNLGNIQNEKLIQTITNTIMRRIWSKIQDRSKIPQSERVPFFLVLDEFASIAHDNMDIEKMLSQARKFRMSVTVCTQQPSQIQSDKIVQEIKNNCESFLTFRVGSANVSEAREIAEALGDTVDPDGLFSLPKYELVGKLRDSDSDESIATKINTFAPYPPLRTEEEMEEEIQRSLKKYGTDESDIGEFEDYAIEKRIGDINGKSDSSKKKEEAIISTDEFKITQHDVLESVHRASIKNGTKKIGETEGWVEYEDVIDELALKKGVDLGYETISDNAIEKIPETYIESKLYDQETLLRLKAEGEKLVYPSDTGSGGSAGKWLHRDILKHGYKTFVKLGYNTKLPKQGGNTQMPDGIAEPPIKPGEKTTVEEMNKAKEELKEKYPSVWNFNKDLPVAIESETTTLNRPMQTLENLKKAIESGQKCAFVVHDGLQEEKRKSNDIDDVARRVEEIITSPSCVRKIHSDEYRLFYNKDTPVALQDNTLPVHRKKSDRSRARNLLWKEDLSSGRINLSLKGDEETKIASFRNATELRNPAKDKFNYYAYKDGSRWVIRNTETGSEVNEYSSKSDLKDDWRVIKQPFIPEREFSEFQEGQLHPKQGDQWDIIIIPDESREEFTEPQLYRNGELYPIYSTLGEITTDDQEDPTSADSIDTQTENLQEETTVVKDNNTENEEDDNIIDQETIQNSSVSFQDNRTKSTTDETKNTEEETESTTQSTIEKEENSSEENRISNHEENTSEENVDVEDDVDEIFEGILEN